MDWQVHKEAAIETAKALSWGVFFFIGAGAILAAFTLAYVYFGPVAFVIPAAVCIVAILYPVYDQKLWEAKRRAKHRFPPPTT